MFFFGIFSSIPSNKPNNGRVTAASGTSTEAVATDDAQHLQDTDDIRSFLTGNPKGFEDLMNRYRHRAYGIAMSVTGDHDVAMDAVQKAFLRIHKSLEKFRLGEPFFPWFYRIVKNASLNQRRDEKRHQGEMPLEWVKKSDGRPNPHELMVADDLRRRLWDGIQELPEEMREVFMLYHFQGQKYRDIAEALNIPLGTVMSRLHAGRTRLRDIVGLEDKK
ncbi:MAG: RNA polymerase sigma factor [bacterium]|nr:RNA polymerase sigma factor [bacterium]